MNSRAVAVLVYARPAAAAPPGVDAIALRSACAEDTYELVAGLDQLDVVVAVCPPDQPDIDALVWPETKVFGVAPSTSAEELHAVLAELTGDGYLEAVVVAADAPDLPGLLVGKLFRGLGRADVAVCPADGGGLVALAAKLPLAEWAFTSEVGLDTADAVELLGAAAPERRALSIAPGWHRLRTPADIARLDPGLEGWMTTRKLLSGGVHP